MLRSNFNKRPVIQVNKNADSYYEGWDAIFMVLFNHLEKEKTAKRIIAVECYQGIYFEEVLNIFLRNIKPDLVITSNDSFQQL